MMMFDHKPLTPEILVPRVGYYLVEKGVISQDDLKRALEKQKSLSEDKPGILLGQVLLEMGIIDRATLDSAITEQIMQLKTRLQETNQDLEQRVAQRTEALQLALQKISEVDELKSNFVANVSHELRTPLTHIKGYLELFINGSLGELSTEQANAIKVMVKASERLEKLIDDLILFTTSEQGELFLQKESFDLGYIIRLIQQRYFQKAKDKKIEINVIMPENFPLVYADKNKIIWVISELVDNAIKFSRERSKININIQPINLTNVRITIQDYGIGIPKEKISDIFKPFHQLDSSPTRKYGGTGLGLSLVQKILEAHQIQIEVDSEINRGTKFSFNLPLKV